MRKRKAFSSRTIAVPILSHAKISKGPDFQSLLGTRYEDLIRSASMPGILAHLADPVRPTGQFPLPNPGGTPSSASRNQ